MPIRKRTSLGFRKSPYSFVLSAIFGELASKTWEHLFGTPCRWPDHHWPGIEEALDSLLLFLLLFMVHLFYTQFTLTHHWQYSGNWKLLSPLYDVYLSAHSAPCDMTLGPHWHWENLLTRDMFLRLRGERRRHRPSLVTCDITDICPRGGESSQALQTAGYISRRISKHQLLNWASPHYRWWWKSVDKCSSDT